jgi:NAD(P)-dependent dehydrogenase (short-subunit alcohol dehydrogenase family)
MFTCDLAERMKPKGVTVNCLDPGTVNTKMLIAGQPYQRYHAIHSEAIQQCSLSA